MPKERKFVKESGPERGGGNSKNKNNRKENMHLRSSSGKNRSYKKGEDVRKSVH